MHALAASSSILPRLRATRLITRLPGVVISLLSHISGYTSLYYFGVHDPLVLGHRALDMFLSRVSVSLFIAPVPFVSYTPIHALRFLIDRSDITFTFIFETLGHPLTFS